MHTKAFATWLTCGLAAVTALTVAALAPGAAHAARAAACAGPVTHDPYDGYHVGVPGGWSVFRVNGRLVVTPSGTSPEQSIVAPVVLTNGLTPARYFASGMGLLDKQIDAIGNAMSYRITSTSGGIPQATLTGRAGKTPVTGHATVIVLPDKTAHGAQLAVLSAYWAPVARLGADASKLAAVALCFGPERAPLFQVLEGNSFTYALPPGFKVTSTGQDELLVGDGKSAEASFLLTLLPASDGITDVQSLQQFVFAHDGIRVTSVLGLSTSARQTLSNGAVGQLENLEFLGVFNGAAVHGLASIYGSVLQGVDASGTIRLALTSASAWNSKSGAVLRIAAGIEHSFAADRQQWERLSQQQQQFGQQVTGFDQALNGEDLVQNSSTGATFEAPYKSYLQGGPDGPGYYAGSAGALQKLTVITPS
jgi:hypothetical protein